ncbi:DUF6456 domain-containing protein [Methylocystis sp. MJC1]|jgi:hypothetical protein|uniref:DUF6456 domain-containing protein n=1 Tax=Methylocystis sp. MJC1 TaxID=2654282 RepID=UPI0013EB38A5|nr:DUF6456 domain-containing protein [Methylocystis sp. MJC1]KAF2989791.1 hypothetical protein MJC1_03136 [Methylocystis sp. MJC1]MBU6526321.1 ATPase [Methylocystis sp. MJC1]UZX12774.1 DUF6456 domain-containing protein [Methylocystis sp. MJC1]
MSKAERKSETSARALRRLLKALNEPGARAAPSGLDDGALVVAAPRNGITLVRARLPVATGEAALAEGLVEGDRESRGGRLRLTEAGRAYLRRAAAAEVALDPFRAQHGEFEKRPGEEGARPAFVNDAESPLAWLARRKGANGRPFLDWAHVEAGERFRRDIEQAQILQRVTANWEVSAAGTRRCGEAGVVVTEIAMDARSRLARAFDAVGPELAGLLTDVCGYLKGLEVVESERGWPARSGKVVLRIALDRLAQHYGLASAAVGPAQAKGLLHWGAEDYRPTV